MAFSMLTAYRLELTTHISQKYYESVCVHVKDVVMLTDSAFTFAQHDSQSLISQALLLTKRSQSIN